MKKFNLLMTCLCMTQIPQLAQAEERENTWVDKQHINVKTTLNSWAQNIDSWISDPDVDHPARARLRVMMDSQWNHYDHFSFKPRVRGKIRLPSLKKRLSLVFGDEDLENQASDKNHVGNVYKKPLDDNKSYNRSQARNDNASIGLRWSDGIKKLGIDTHLDLGIRSGADVYVRFKGEKGWQINDDLATRLEQIYRYGSNSKHYVRTNFETTYSRSVNTFIGDNLYLQYEHDIDEDISWGNSIYQQHDFANDKRLSYGIFIGGDLDHNKFDINQYGPFISWRQPIWRKWLFIQPELNYYNDRSQDRNHHLGAFVRLEAIF
ncbi:outer membrane protein [Haemophilus parainfluenzae]|uniref:Outer membrane protein n=1 Tax=Haemophilus parainfluenzae TaxID=729 RepID=A0A3S4W771_HAEPA|nr:hypothetical protein [Haemophilus parainfluenzae]VEI31524.1 outer membrane protein [Haemophilus parainfluenzae]